MITEKQEPNKINSTEEISAEEVVEQAVESIEVEKTEPITNDEIKEEDGQQRKEDVPAVKFDWNKQSDSDYSEEEEEEMARLYISTLKSLENNEVLEGKVVAKTDRDVVINIDYKSEGVISLNEFRYNPNLAIDDIVDVLVEKQEDKTGQLILSHKRARTLKAWKKANELLESQEIITGKIICRTKGGMIVDVLGLETFLPGSQIDVKPIRDYDLYVDKTMEFKVVKINQEFRNIVISHKAILEEEIAEQKEEIMKNLEKGQILEGTVKNITNYGVFMDLGGVDGLIHITDLSWGRVNDPNQVVKLDEKINVVILDFDEAKKRIALGLKQLTDHPWEKVENKYKVDDKVNGKVVVIADYGCFVELEAGIEGLIHVSEVSWSSHQKSASEYFKVGDEIEAKVLTLDKEEKKMSLGIKQLIPDPWKEIEKEFKIESQHKAIVKNFTNFGIFVEIKTGIDGLIHISDLSWTKKIKHPAEFAKIGDEIEVVVLEIDVENRRLRLGHKQLEDNPWDVFETVFTINSIHEGTVADFLDKGAKIELQYGLEAFAYNKSLIKEDDKMPLSGDKLQVKIIEFSKDTKKILVSHTAIREEDKRKEKIEENKINKKAIKDIESNLDKATLGDFGEALQGLKKEMIVETKKKLDEKEAKTTTKKPKEKKETKTPVKKKTTTTAKKTEEKKETKTPVKKKTTTAKKTKEKK